MWIGFNGCENNARFKKKAEECKCHLLLSFNSAGIIKHLYIIGGVLHLVGKKDKLSAHIRLEFYR